MDRIESYNLFGESDDLPDVVHCETIAARSVKHDWELTPHRHARLHQVLLVARGGGRGTLEEICYALDFERRVLTWDSWPMDGAEKITSLEQCEAALVEHLEAALLAQLGDSNNA